MIRFGLAWGPTAILLAVLFALSAQSGLGAGMPVFVNDKLAHAFAYTLLGSTLAWGWWRSDRSPSRVALLILGLLWAASDEWHQSFVPGRTASFGDFLADSVGLLLGLVIASLAIPALLNHDSPPATDRPGAST